MVGLAKHIHDCLRCTDYSWANTRLSIYDSLVRHMPVFGCLYMVGLERQCLGMAYSLVKPVFGCLAMVSLVRHMPV